jgi:hypothetical protein
MGIPHRRMLWVLVLTFAPFTLMPTALATDAAKLLSGKLVKITQSEVVLQVAGERGPQKVAFLIDKNSKLDAAQPGDTINVIYSKHSRKTVLVRLIRPGPKPKQQAVESFSVGSNASSHGSFDQSAGSADSMPSALPPPPPLPHQ